MGPGTASASAATLLCGFRLGSASGGHHEGSEAAGERGGVPGPAVLLQPGSPPSSPTAARPVCSQPPAAANSRLAHQPRGSLQPCRQLQRQSLDRTRGQAHPWPPPGPGSSPRRRLASLACTVWARSAARHCFSFSSLLVP